MRAARSCKKTSLPGNYLTEEDWFNIQSDNMTFSSKASVIIRRLRLIGLNTPSETTYVHIVALMYCANKAHYAVNVNPVTALATVRDVKVLFKSWKSVLGSFMSDFPMSPDDLKKRCRQLSSSLPTRRARQWPHELIRLR